MHSSNELVYCNCEIVTMETLKITVALFILFVCQHAKGTSTHERCTVYDIGETIPAVESGMGRHCENSTGPFMIYKEGETTPDPIMKTYCLDYECPHLDCDADDIVKVDGKCDRCTADCEWLGKIVKNGTGGTCEDGCNGCGCTNGAVSFTTLMACPTAFCYPPRE